MKFLYSFWIFLDAKKKRKNQYFEKKVDTTINTMETFLEDLVKKILKSQVIWNFPNFIELLNKECWTIGSPCGGENQIPTSLSYPQINLRWIKVLKLKAQLGNY